MKNIKKYRIDIRLSELIMKKLLAICSATGKTRTEAIEDLILEEFKRKKIYEDFYYSKLIEEDGNDK